MYSYISPIIASVAISRIKTKKLIINIRHCENLKNCYLIKLFCTGHVARMGVGKAPFKILMSDHLKGGRRVDLKVTHKGLKYINRGIWDLGFEGRWTERAADRTRWRRMFTALGFRTRRDLGISKLLL